MKSILQFEDIYFFNNEKIKTQTLSIENIRKNYVLNSI